MTQICGPKKIHRPIWNLTWKTSINCWSTSKLPGILNRKQFD
jgi:hypothetical protein